MKPGGIKKQITGKSKSWKSAGKQVTTLVTVESVMVIQFHNNISLKCNHLIVSGN